jgi:hypothetical protein
MWVTVVIFLSVIGWSYSIISLLSLVQDKGFQQVLLTARFVRRVRQLGEPFYILCGCGETGLLIARALDRDGMRSSPSSAAKRASRNSNSRTSPPTFSPSAPTRRSRSSS